VGFLGTVYLVGSFLKKFRTKIGDQQSHGLRRRAQEGSTNSESLSKRVLIRMHTGLAVTVKNLEAGRSATVQKAGLTMVKQLRVTEMTRHAIIYGASNNFIVTETRQEHVTIIRNT
jgi:hypothetical protein